jgi:hypothetical protein
VCGSSDASDNWIWKSTSVASYTGIEYKRMACLRKYIHAAIQLLHEPLARGALVYYVEDTMLLEEYSSWHL